MHACSQIFACEIVLWLAHIHPVARKLLHMVPGYNEQESRELLTTTDWRMQRQVHNNRTKTHLCKQLAISCDEREGLLLDAGRPVLDARQDRRRQAVDARIDLVAHECFRLLHKPLDLALLVHDHDAIFRWVLHLCSMHALIWACVQAGQACMYVCDQCAEPSAKTIANLCDQQCALCPSLLVERQHLLERELADDVAACKEVGDRKLMIMHL